MPHYSLQVVFVCKITGGRVLFQLGIFWSTLVAFVLSCFWWAEIKDEKQEQHLVDRERKSRLALLLSFALLQNSLDLTWGGFNIQFNAGYVQYSLKRWLAGRYREFLKGQFEERLKEKAPRSSHGCRFSVLSCEMLSFVICVVYVSLSVAFARWKQTRKRSW